MLAWPVAVAIGAVVGAVWASRYRHAIDNWLAQNKINRLAAFIVIQGIVPAVAAIFVEAADFSDLFQGQIPRHESRTLTILTGLTSIFIWGQFVLYWHESRWEQRLADEREQRKTAEDKYDLAQRSLDYLIEVSKTFLQVVGFKHARIRDLIERDHGAEALTVSDLVTALAPRDQMIRILHAAFLIGRSHLKPGSDLRIAYFESDGTYLVPKHSWDGTSSNCCSSALERHREKFRIDSAAAECLAVHVVHTASIRVVPDAEAADIDPNVPFRFFDTAQRSVIRSAVAIPLRLSRDSASPIGHVICLDTNERGGFHEGQEQAWVVLREQVQQRLMLERDVETITARLN